MFTSSMTITEFVEMAKSQTSSVDEPWVNFISFLLQNCIETIYIVGLQGFANCRMIGQNVFMD